MSFSLSILRIQARYNYFRGEEPRILVDGILGPQTKKALNEIKDKSLFLEFKKENKIIYKNQGNSNLCSLYSSCQLLNYYGFDINPEEANLYIDSSFVYNEIAENLGFYWHVENNKTEQISKIMERFINDITGTNIVKLQYVDEIELKMLLNKRPVILATDFTASGHYVLAKMILRLFENDVTVIINDSYGKFNPVLKKYESKNGENCQFEFKKLLQFLKKDGTKKYRIIG